MYILVHGSDKTLAASHVHRVIVLRTFGPLQDHCGMIVGEAFFEDEEDSATQSVSGECSRVEQ